MNVAFHVAKQTAVVEELPMYRQPAVA